MSAATMDLFSYTFELPYTKIELSNIDNFKILFEQSTTSMIKFTPKK